MATHIASHAPASGGPQDEALWHRIETHHIGPADAELSFAVRLARENRWSAEYAERVIHEYRRFCYLACTAGAEVTPSDAVDQAWHLHLTYSRDYWQVFCPEVLLTDLHHGPTNGTNTDRTRYYEQYAATLRAYEDAFGMAPAPDIWPDARRRFTIDPMSFRVNPADAIVLKRAQAIALGVSLAVLGMAAGWLAGGVL